MLLYDHNDKRYDLHPVVRGVVAGAIQDDIKEEYGKRVVDYFSSQTPIQYEKVKSIDDVKSGLNIVRILLKMRHYVDAFNFLTGDLLDALFKIEAYKETLALLRPFFVNGWDVLPTSLDKFEGSILANYASMILYLLGESFEAIVHHEYFILDALEQEDVDGLSRSLEYFAIMLRFQNNLAVQSRMLELSSTLITGKNEQQSSYSISLGSFELLSCMGQFSKAEGLWKELNSMARDRSQVGFELYKAEVYYTLFRFWRGDLEEEQITKAEFLASEGKSLLFVRKLRGIRGEWLIEQGRWQNAVESLDDAVRMTRNSGVLDPFLETWLAFAKLCLGKLLDPLPEVERLSRFPSLAHRPLAKLWYAIGNQGEATKHALEAYKWAWASGEPFVHRYELNKIIKLLNQWSIEVPKLPPYDPANNEKFPWESKIEELIKKLKANNAQKK